MNSYEITFLHDKGVQMGNLVHNVILAADEAEHIYEIDDENLKQAIENIKRDIMPLKEHISAFLHATERLQMDVCNNQGENDGNSI